MASTATEQPLSPTAGADAPSSTPQIQSGPTVFVGNLLFSTTAEDVTKLFGEDKVQSVRLIKKFGRFKGYGFVSFSSQQDADQAVSNWNGKETNGRELKVQPATEPKPIPVRPVKAALTGAGPETTEESGDKKKKRKPRKPKKRVDDAAAPAAEEPSSKPAPATSATEGDKTEKPKKPRNRTNRRGSKGAAAASSDDAAAQSTSAAAPAPRKRENNRTNNSAPSASSKPRELSKTSLFVGNLPFEVDDEDLKGLFSEFKVENARVVRYGERSKGFGFVYFYDEKTCNDAKTEFEGALLENRALVVKNAFKED